MQQTDHAAHFVGRAIEEARFAVSSSIAVREEYKAKLRALLAIIAPTTWTRQPSFDALTRSKQKKTTALAECQTLKLVQGKEIHVLGDLLLLIRTASVDVVENVQAWREVVHEGVPRPYIYNFENYLLKMCEDLDFLDQVDDLVEWLGFRLLRNPFIADNALDDVVSSRLGINVHDDRSLKYWSSASWYQNNRLANHTVLKSSKTVDCQSPSVYKAHWKKQPPPQPLVKPLVSISPEDDVVDGSRIAAAQQILLEEESFHGRLLALKTVEEYLARGPSIFERHNVDNNAGSVSLYDAIATQHKTTEYRSSLLRRERTQVERTIRDLENQMKWTELSRGSDRTNDPRARHCREKYQQEMLKLYAKLVEEIERRHAVLKDEENHFADVLDQYKCRMSELRLEKEKQRATTHNKKKEEEASWREGIRKRTEQRVLRSKKKRPQQRHQTNPAAAVDPMETTYTTSDNMEADIARDIRVIVEKESSIPRTSRETLNLQLEEKRQRMVYQKRARLEQQARIAKEKERLLDSRRAESVTMKREDSLSRIVEHEAKKKAQLRDQKELLNRVASCAKFKCMHEMNGKRFLISVYIRHARGYDLEGLRIVAYDPTSSATSTMVMTLREFDSLGYGHTSNGLMAFCKWLCLLYEKRRRQFRLVWSGAPCPLPLRISENDQTLVCLHKEGVRMKGSRTSLVAVYMRMDNRTTVRFEVGTWYNHEFLLSEHAVASRSLVIGTDLDVQWRSTDHAMIVWKHHACEEKDNSSAISSTAIGQRVYSNEVTVNQSRYAVHMYDTNEDEYTVELIPKPRKGDSVPEVIYPLVRKQLVLNKRNINPYGVHLSSSNYADLISLIRFEQTQLLESTKDSNEGTQFTWKATISPKWTGKLAKYVRVLRLAKYARKISGVFCFIAVFIVQQKTEFRAHLLLEVTWLRPTLSSSSPLGGVPARQSMRIALSDYLRCANASRRFAAGLAYSEDDECPSCLGYTNATALQRHRLHAIKELIVHAGVIAPEALEVIYHGYCERCATLTPPIVLVLGSTTSTTVMVWLLPLLEHYFVSFDCSKIGFLHFEEDGGHTITEEGLHVRATLLQALARDQVVVLFNADCGVTVANANAFVHELHWWLYPDHHDLPYHVAYIVGGDKDVNSYSRDHRDHDLLEALQGLKQAACQIAQLDPVRLDDGDNEESDRASAFDAYLVAEAMLVEATRVLLYPDYVWQKPREIMGASSWSSACSFLLDPVQLSVNLQQCNPLQLGTTTAEVLDAYFAHPKWPRHYPDVRSFFYGLLAFMMHLQHVRRILASRSGSLQNSMKCVAEAEVVAEREQLAKNTSVLDCSHLGDNLI